MASYCYTEAVDLITGDDDLEDINVSDLEDTESDDGDIEVADYITSSGEAQLVSHSEEDADDEPALRDSSLLLDEDLRESDETELENECCDMEVEASEISDSDNDDHSSPSSRSSVTSGYLSHRRKWRQSCRQNVLHTNLYAM